MINRRYLILLYLYLKQQFIFKMFKRKLVVSLFLLFIAYWGYSQNFSNKDFDSVRLIIRDQIDKDHIPSISIAVIYKNSVVWEESFGYANKEKKILSTIYTPYYLASVTKTITATAILQLADKKKIQLDSPVNNYLGKAKISSPMWDTKGATVKRMLLHTAGLTTHNRDCFFDEEKCPISEDTTLVRYGIVYWQPGDHFDYSNIGYQVLGRVIKDRSNTSLANYFQSNIFKPLGMLNSFLFESTLPENVAIRYSGDSPYIASPVKLSNTPAASSCYSSVHDLTKFALLHLNSKEASKNVLSSKSIQAMREGKEHGLGWWINENYYGYKSFLSQGGTFDAMTWLRLIPSEGVAVIVLSNTGSADCGSIIDKTLSILLKPFRDNLMKGDQAATETNNKKPIPDLFLGQWKGYIQTYNNELPFEIVLSNVGENYSGSDIKRKIDNVNYENGMISFDANGDLNTTEDTGKGPYGLNFNLYRKDNFLYGCVTTFALDTARTPRLSYWVKLTQTF